jgi:hypothetical protein
MSRYSVKDYWRGFSRRMLLCFALVSWTGAFLVWRDEHNAVWTIGLVLVAVSITAGGPFVAEGAQGRRAEERAKYHRLSHVLGTRRNCQPDIRDADRRTAAPRPLTLTCALSCRRCVAASPVNLPRREPSRLTTFRSLSCKSGGFVGRRLVPRCGCHSSGNRQRQRRRLRSCSRREAGAATSGTACMIAFGPSKRARPGRHTNNLWSVGGVSGYDPGIGGI